MSRDWTKIWMAALIVAFCAEHIWIVTRPSPITIDPINIVCRAKP
jgi:hypothetical protein